MRLRVLRVAATTLAAILLLLGHPTAAHAKNAEPKARAKSLGSPNEGKLDGGRRLEPSKSVRAVGGHRWGMPALVGMLERSATRVAKRFPGSVLVVGDLSQRGGGDIDGHRSHESGRDADVGFYFVKGGKPFQPRRFATVDPDGRVRGLASVRFDDARNWSLVESWITDPKANVIQVFVAEHVKARLLAHARAAGASDRVIARAASVMIQPRRGLPHDNHFHVRIACPSGQRGCVNFGTREAKARPPQGPKARARGRLAHAAAPPDAKAPLRRAPRPRAPRR